MSNKMEENRPPVAVRWVDLVLPQAHAVQPRASEAGCVNFKLFRSKHVSRTTQNTQSPVNCTTDVETQRKGMQERGHLVRCGLVHASLLPLQLLKNSPGGMFHR